LGIGALVQGLAAELAPRVRVNAVAPTFMGTRTQFWKHVPGIEEIASAYVHLMNNGFITGQVIAVDGGVMLRK